MQHNGTKACVALLGYAGCGKTSIAQIVCGRRAVPDSAIGHCEPKTPEFVLYQGKEFNVWDSRGYLPTDTYDSYFRNFTDFIKDIRDRPLSELPQVVWYCISGTGARVTKLDEQMLLKLKESRLPTMIAITKCEVSKHSVMKGIRDYLSGEFGCFSLIFLSSAKKTGFTELYNKTSYLLPAGQNRISELRDECFIATAVFMDRNSPTVKYFRCFRDEYLRNRSWGNIFILRYYKYSPCLADYIRNRTILRSATRYSLKVLRNLCKVLHPGVNISKDH